MQEVKRHKLFVNPFSVQLHLRLGTTKPHYSSINSKHT